MKNGRYIFLLTVLTAFLFGVSQWLSDNTPEPHKQTQKAMVKAKQENGGQRNPVTRKKQTRKIPQVRVVTLYPAGSLAVKKPEKKPVVKKVVTPKPVVRPMKTVAVKEKDVPTVSRSYKGDRPKLEMGYEAIGFDQYIDVMERVGRLFVLIEDDNKVELGPEVSLKRKTLLGDRGIQNRRYALDRPHLIADPFIEDLLSELELPSNALKDRVVLVFNRPFDNLLWDIIGSVAAANDLNLENIAQVSGDYVDNGNGIFLRLDRAVMKDSLKELPFYRSIRVTL